MNYWPDSTFGSLSSIPLLYQILRKSVSSSTKAVDSDSHEANESRKVSTSLSVFTHDITCITCGSMDNSLRLKGTKREILRAMHVKELIQSNHSEW